MGGGRDDLDLYGRGAAPRRAAGWWFLRVLGVVVGAAGSLFGVGLFALRCFDTCPEDRSIDIAIQLLSAALVLFGLVVAVASVAVATRREPGAATFVGALGAIIAAAGAIVLLLVASTTGPVDEGGTATAGAVALVAGGGVTAGAVFRRRSSARTGD
ncbi:MAG: hypothetical protein M3134_00355 [Actinomycetota bacterium]|nr:hypothetical protein [Actinomycetota bacterium]